VLVARPFAKEGSVVHVAISPSAWERHRHRSWAVVAVGVAGMAFGLVFGGLLLALVVALVCFSLHATGANAGWLSVSKGEGPYFVSGAHPAFQKAALELARLEDDAPATIR